MICLSPQVRVVSFSFYVLVFLSNFVYKKSLPIRRNLVRQQGSKIQFLFFFFQDFHYVCLNLAQIRILLNVVFCNL